MVLALIGLVTASFASTTYALTSITPYIDNAIFSPPSDYNIPRTLYAHSLLIAQDGNDTNVLLSTWENYSPEPPSVYFPVYRSTDLGQTWTHISNITDTVNGWGLRYQPFLYELPQPFGTYSAGTILAAGNSIPTDLSQTQIDLYASTDKGYTWTFVSHIAAGGEAEPTNGLTPVWEPFLYTYDNQLIVYYSDQRDPSYGQKIVHQVTTDLVNWGDVVDNIAMSTYSDRPGMFTVAELPNGKYVGAFEWGGSPVSNLAAYIRMSDSPLTFGSVDPAGDMNVKATTGEQTKSSPFVVWTAAGGANGTIIVSANSHSGLFVNTALGAPGSNWTYMSSTATRGYSRDLRILPTNNQILMTCGGSLGGSSNKVMATVLDL